MQFKIKVNEGKKQAFLQIMRALGTLGVVESIELIEGGRPQNGDRDDSWNWSDEVEGDKTTQEMAKQYRDLVD